MENGKDDSITGIIMPKFMFGKFKKNNNLRHTLKMKNFNQLNKNYYFTQLIFKYICTDE